MSCPNESLPSIPKDKVVNSDLHRIAYLSHGPSEKRTVLALLRRTLRRHGVPKEKVFCYEPIVRRGNIEDGFTNLLKRGLLESRYLIVFLTPEFLSKWWTMWELRAFLNMMKADKRRKLLPVFYRLSSRECEEIAKKEASSELKIKLGLHEVNEEVRQVMEKAIRQFGIEAEAMRMSDADVVEQIMRDVFDLEMSSDGSVVNVDHETHDSTACSTEFCTNRTCAERMKSDLNDFFAVPPFPRYTRLDYMSSVRPEKLMRDKLLSNRSNAYAAVGMGGTGKTTCLICVAQDFQVRELFPDGTLWIPLSKETKVEKVREVFFNILKYAWYCWKERDSRLILSRQAPLDAVVRATENLLKKKSCLIVLDDFWPFHDFEIVVTHFKQILGPSSRILLSTQSNEVVERFGADPTAVGFLDDETASILFDGWCGWSPEGEVEENLKKQVLKLCSNLAVAVCNAGSDVRRFAKFEGRKHGLERMVENLRQLDHVPEEQMAELRHIAYVSHHEEEKRSVVGSLRQELRKNRIDEERVCFYELIERGGTRHEEIKNLRENELRASEYLIVFLTLPFLRDPLLLWELRTFLEMMRKDGRKKLLPIFHRVSKRHCENIAELKVAPDLNEDGEELRDVLEKVTSHDGIDSEEKKMPDVDVAGMIIEHVFNLDDRITIFLSHAGEDKYSFIGFLKRAIETRDTRVRCYLDESELPGNDRTITEELRNAIGRSQIGVFVLSPEFVAKKYTMWELERFLWLRWLREDAGPAAGIRPSLYPIFHRLTVGECKNKNNYLCHKEEYRHIFEKYEFYSKQRQAERSWWDAMSLLRRISRYPGSSWDGKTYLDQFAAHVAENIIKLARQRLGAYSR